MRAREHIRGNVVGYVALFVALSGTAWAAATIGAGDIERNAVRSRHIAPNQVRGVDVNERTLGRVPIANSAIHSDFFDGLDSGDFLLRGAAAGGDLTGVYPNPSIKPAAIANVPHAAAADQAANAALLDNLDSTDFVRPGAPAAGGDLEGSFNALVIKNGVVGPENFAAIPLISAYDTTTQPVSAPTCCQELHVANVTTASGITHPYSDDFTAPVNGSYLVIVGLRFASNGGVLDPSTHTATFRLNRGFTEVEGSSRSITFATVDVVNSTLAYIVPMLAGQSLHVEFTGSDTTVRVVGADFSMHWIGPTV